LAKGKATYHLVNNSLENLGNPNSDFNYGPWGQIVAASPYSGYKGFFYEGGITVPLVIKGPKSIMSNGNASGTNIIKGYVRMLDITPTILELANVSHPSTYKGHEVSPMIGKSLTGILEGKTNKVYQADEPLAAELFNGTVVRMGDWMAIHNEYDESKVWNLYNLANDTGQNSNVADQHPDMMQKLRAAYEKYSRDVGVIIPRDKKYEAAVQG
jgi:arylsulfatase